MLRDANTTTPTFGEAFRRHLDAAAADAANHPAQGVTGHACASDDAAGSSSFSMNMTAASGQSGPGRAAKRGQNGPLGSIGTYVGRSDGSEAAKKLIIKEKSEKTRQEKRTRLFVLQRTAADILDNGKLNSVSACCYALQWGRTTVGVMLKQYDESRRASFDGVQRCGSVWHCPVCGKVISARRRDEMNTALSVVRAAGGFPVLMTLTARHGRRNALADLLDRMKRALRRMRQRRDWKAFRAKYSGLTITATEVTHGFRNGWHPHFHILVMVSGVDDEPEAVDVVEALRGAWMSAMTAEGLSGNGAAFDVRGAGAAGDYVAKWGAAEELAFGDAKEARKGNRTPLQLLDAATDGDAEARRLWAEYAAAFKGRRQLVWSDGLKAACGIGEVEDGEAAGDELADEPQEAFRIDGEEWRHRGRYRRGHILTATERGGAEAGKAALRADAEDIPRTHRTAPAEVIEDDDPASWDLPTRTASPPPPAVPSHATRRGQEHGGQDDTDRTQEAAAGTGQGGGMDGGQPPHRAGTRGGPPGVRGQPAAASPADRPPATLAAR